MTEPDRVVDDADEYDHLDDIEVVPGFSARHRARRRKSLLERIAATISARRRR